MWKKGELVWVSLNPSDSWIPGRILDLSEPFGILVSFFDLMKPRYVPKPCIRSFERDFKTLVADSWRFRRFVDRALQTLFWNISFGLRCSCQSPIDSPNLDRGISHPLSPPRSSNSALGFVREMAVAKRVPLRRLAKTNSLTAQILSFKRYTVDLNRSESVYKDVRESAKLMVRAEEPDWYLDPSYKMDCIDDMVYMFPEAEDTDVDDSRDLSLGNPLLKDIHCCSVDEVVQSWNKMNPLINSDSSVMKACATMARVSYHEDAAHPLKSRERCQVEQSVCFPVEVIIEEDIPVAAQREAPPDVMIETHDDITGSDDRTWTSAEQVSPLLGASNGKAFLAKPVSFVVLEETSTNPRSKLDSTMISASTLDEDRSGRNGTRENCPEDALESHFADARHVSLHITSKSKRRKKTSHQSIFADKPQLQLLKDKCFADPKCLRMRFLSTHGKIPSKSELLKRFSVFGKIDASRTDVNPGGSSAKVVFLQSIDAVTAYQFVKKIKLGQSKVVYRLDAFEEDMEVNKVPLSQKPQQSVPSPRSCLKNMVR